LSINKKTRHHRFWRIRFISKCPKITRYYFYHQTFLFNRRFSSIFLPFQKWYTKLHLKRREINTLLVFCVIHESQSLQFFFIHLSSFGGWDVVHNSDTTMQMLVVGQFHLNKNTKFLWRASLARFKHYISSSQCVGLRIGHPDDTCCNYCGVLLKDALNFTWRNLFLDNIKMINGNKWKFGICFLEHTKHPMYLNMKLALSLMYKFSYWSKNPMSPVRSQPSLSMPALFN
jgi:hypothetical protein